MPDVIVKDAVAEIEPGKDDDESPHGTFEVILSAPVKDRDGETLKPDEWEQPLPAHITFDIDHGMSVASTVGSGSPSLDEDGNLRVAGSYASTDLGQTTRALVNEGHIRTTSVAFLRKSSSEKGKKRVTRELLNGAFVAVPANPAALVLTSKAVKEGRRNSSSDATTIQAIHDHATTLGATCGDKSGKATRKAAEDTATNERVAELERVIAHVLDLVAEVDPETLPEPVSEALASLAEHGSNPDEQESSAVDDDADSSAADAAEQSADESAADLARALAVRAHGIRVLSAGMTNTED